MRIPYEYAIIQAVPRIERGELINVGVVLYSQRLDFLAARTHLHEDRLRALDPDVDIPAVAAALASWEATCTGLWLLTLSSLNLPELVTALAAAVPCVVLAVTARRAVGGSWAPRPRWTAWLLPLPAAVLADTGRVLARAVGALAGRRIPLGGFTEVQLPRDRPQARWRARQVIAAGLVTTTPGTVVVDLDAESGRMLLHPLGSGPPAMEEVVRR